jgi:acyl-CoA thioester hydrolase
MSSREDVVVFRVRYSETDQMGTFYNSRALEWFECGRTELMRSLGLPYAEMERRGVMLPLVEAHVEFRGRARYDDQLRMTSRGSLVGKARLRVDCDIVHVSNGAPVARGYTVHAVTDKAGKPMRPPSWLQELFAPNGAKVDQPD